MGRWCAMLWPTDCGSAMRGIDPATFFDPSRPRLTYPGRRPVSCR